MVQETIPQENLQAGPIMERKEHQEQFSRGSCKEITKQ